LGFLKHKLLLKRIAIFQLSVQLIFTNYKLTDLSREFCMLKSALIVAAYNRPENLRQLLSMLSLSNYDGNSVDLVVSIDFSDKQIDVSEVVQKVDWVHGQKKIILQKENLGLKKHILF